MTDSDRVMQKAVRRVAAILDLNDEDFGDAFDRARAVRLVALYDALVKLLGGDEVAKKWMQCPNDAFGGQSPRSRLKQAEGLDQVTAYVEGHLYGR